MIQTHRTSAGPLRISLAASHFSYFNITEEFNAVDEVLEILAGKGPSVKELQSNTNYLFILMASGCKNTLLLANMVIILG